MSRLEVDADVEVVLAQAALAGRLTWGQVAETLMPGPDVEAAAARSLDAYRALGGTDPNVDRAFYRGRIADYQQPDDDTSGWPAEVRRRWAVEALERLPERPVSMASRAITADVLGMDR
ncbi:MAG TPA: hypothetical protein VMW49_03765 [Candidatus Dormibacteraeota bacterium]|nr:hypothetical protein [Candidatus Dormibacteraeota bacterium]